MAEKMVRLADSTDVNRSWRRISTGKLSFLYIEEKIVPNYLKSPTGSCHDACKYGTTHEDSQNNKPPRRKRVNRSFSETLNLDSPIRKKALTNSTLKPCGKHDSVCGSETEARNFSCKVCDDVKKMNVQRTEKKAVTMPETQLVDTIKRKKMTFNVSRGRALSKSEKIVQQNRRLTALKLKSVAQTAAIALQRSYVPVKKTKAAEPKKAVVSPKRCARSLRTRKERSSLSVPSIKTRKRVEEKCNELAEEKTLYVIKMETANEIVESDQNQRCVMDSPTDDRKSEISQEECVEDETDNQSSLEEEEEERGKIVEFGSQDNSPRKLKFKRGKTLTLKTSNLSNGKEHEHKPRFVLKRQETQKKKDSGVVLFNNVIEETANKLVVTRKSKVKALVGAFETVISLQEQISSPTTENVPKKKPILRANSN